MKIIRGLIATALLVGLTFFAVRILSAEPQRNNLSKLEKTGDCGRYFRKEPNGTVTFSYKLKSTDIVTETCSGETKIYVNKSMWATIPSVIHDEGSLTFVLTNAEFEEAKLCLPNN